jgi:ectoine hydroxylase-related dioxygenase (phytanoyl-CoA dioxygenase family)
MNSPVQFIVPEAGTLIIFPSWLEHGVNQNLGNADRISIAFNINLFHERMVGNPDGNRVQSPMARSPGSTGRR